jgi:hypothetical protein
MAIRRRSSGEPYEEPYDPPTTPEGRENKLISLAADLAEKQFREGTASAQVITHYLKLGSSREILEQERLRHENELLKVKREAIESQSRVEELYRNAIDAMRVYSGQKPIQSDSDYDDD